MTQRDSFTSKLCLRFTRFGHLNCSFNYIAIRYRTLSRSCPDSSLALCACVACRKTAWNNNTTAVISSLSRFSPFTFTICISICCIPSLIQPMFFWQSESESSLLCLQYFLLVNQSNPLLLYRSRGEEKKKRFPIETVVPYMLRD